MINPRLSAVWSTIKPIAPFSCAPGLQEVHTLYTWCTKDRFGRTPNCRDSRINHMFRNTFPMRDN